MLKTERPRFHEVTVGALVMEKNKATNPVDICLLGADAAMLRAQHVPDLIEQSKRLRWPFPLLINCRLGSATHIQQPLAVRKSRGKLKKPLLVHCYKDVFLR